MKNFLPLLIYLFFFVSSVTCSEYKNTYNANVYIQRDGEMIIYLDGHYYIVIDPIHANGCSCYD